MSCNEIALNRIERSLLLATALQAVGYAARERSVMEVDLAAFPATFHLPRATFVTIKRSGMLRGCVGMIDACRPLIVDVVHNAYASALEDHRFPPLSTAELTGLSVSVSILTPPEEIFYTDETDLLSKLRPGRDGVILEKGFNRGLFLPVMWKQLPAPEDFFSHLKMKAGWRPTFWSKGIRAYRFGAEYVSESGEPDD